MTVFSEKLEKYAELIVKVGVNVQPEQKVVIMAPVDAAPLVRLISKYAFEVGAEDVIMDWRDEELGALRYKNAPLRVLKVLSSPCCRKNRTCQRRRLFYLHHFRRSGFT